MRSNGSQAKTSAEFKGGPKKERKKKQGKGNKGWALTVLK